MDTPAAGAEAAQSRSNYLSLLLLAIVVVVGLIFAFSSSIYLPNNWYALFKWVHVTFAVIWIGGGMMLTLLAIRAQQTKEPAKLVLIAEQAAFAGEKIFAPAGMVVFLMGIAMMINTDWGWGHFWIVAGIIGYATTFVTGVAILSPLAKKIEASGRDNGPEHPTTLALIDRIMLLVRVDMAVLLLVVADMVTKPFA